MSRNWEEMYYVAEMEQPGQVQRGKEKKNTTIANGIKISKPNELKLEIR